MRTFLTGFAGGLVGAASLLVFTARQPARVEPAAPLARYELHESGAVGALVRLDKVTGETVIIPAF